MPPQSCHTFSHTQVLEFEGRPLYWCQPSTVSVHTLHAGWEGCKRARRGVEMAAWPQHRGRLLCWCQPSTVSEHTLHVGMRAQARRGGCEVGRVFRGLCGPSTSSGCCTGASPRHTRMLHAGGCRAGLGAKRGEASQKIARPKRKGLSWRRTLSGDTHWGCGSLVLT